MTIFHQYRGKFKTGGSGDELLSEQVPLLADSIESSSFSSSDATTDAGDLHAETSTQTRSLVDLPSVVPYSHSVLSKQLGTSLVARTHLDDDDLEGSATTVVALCSGTHPSVERTDRHGRTVPRDSMWGLALYACSTLFTSGMSITAKLAGRLGLPVSQITLAQGLVILLFALVPVFWKRMNPLGNRRGLLVLRGLVGFGSSATLYASVQLLPLADATLLFFLAPLWVAAMGPIILKEHPSRAVWGVLPFCMLGVVLVAQPTFLFKSKEALSLVGVMVGCSQAVFAGSVRMVVRDLRLTEHTSVIVLYMAGSTVVMGAAWCGLVPNGFVLPSNWTQVMLMILTGLLAYANQVTLTYGLRYAKASTATALTYLSMLWAELAAIFIFKEWPNMMELLGAGLIGVCTVFLAVAEARKAARQIAKEAEVLATVVAVVAANDSMQRRDLARLSVRVHDDLSAPAAPAA